MDLAPIHEPRSFLPAFGKASCLLAIFSIAFTKMFSWALDALRDSVGQAEVSSSLVSVVSIIGLVIGFLITLAALVFGVLSLFGKGKVEGTSRPMLGIVGILVSGIMMMAFSSVPVAIKAAREAKSRASKKSVVDEKYGIELSWPGKPWILANKQQTATLHPEAILAAVRQVEEQEESLLGLVFVEEIETSELMQISPDEMAEMIMSTLGSQDMAIEFSEKTEYQGYPAFVFQFSGKIDGEARTRGRNIVVLQENRVIRLFCAGPQKITDFEGVVFQPFFDAVVLK